MSVPAISPAFPPVHSKQPQIGGMRSLSEIVFPKMNLDWRYRKEDTTDLSREFQSEIVKVLSLSQNDRDQISDHFLFTPPDEIASVLKAASQLDQVDLVAILGLSLILEQDRVRVVNALISIPKEERTAIFDRSTRSIQEHRTAIIVRLSSIRLADRLKIIELSYLFTPDDAGPVIETLAKVEIDTLHRLAEYFKSPCPYKHAHQFLKSLLSIL